MLLLVIAVALSLATAACAEDADVTEPGDADPGEGEDEEAFDAEAHFSGETVHILVGFSAGGGFDAYARILVNHIDKYIPRNPNVVVQNMTGVGGLVLAAHMIEEAEPRVAPGAGGARRRP